MAQTGKIRTAGSELVFEPALPPADLPSGNDVRHFQPRSPRANRAMFGLPANRRFERGPADKFM
jgi:hypothetical protein